MPIFLKLQQASNQLADNDARFTGVSSEEAHYLAAEKRDNQFFD